MSEDKGSKAGQEEPTSSAGRHNTFDVTTGVGNVESVAGGLNFNSGPGAGSDVTGTQNNVRGNQYNAGQDQFIGNRNVSTGGGGIEDYGGVQGGVHNYGGVQGGVNSGSGSQTNIRAGDITGNSGNVGVGSNINQSYSAGGQAADPKAAALLTALEDIRDSVDDLTGDDRKNVREPLTAAIKSLRSGQLDSNTVTTALQQASTVLSDMDNMIDARKALKSAAAAAGLNVR